MARKPKDTNPRVSITFPSSWNQGGSAPRKLYTRGRPRSYATIEELELKIEQYFDWCEEDKKMPNTAGLALFLNISRETLNNYGQKGHDYYDAIKKANDKIEEAWVQNLKWGQAGGSIFYLKNKFGYRDVPENPGGLMTINFILPPELAEKYGLQSLPTPAPAQVIEPAQLPENATPPQTTGDSA